MSKRAVEIPIEFNGKQVTIYRDPQSNDLDYCGYLNPKDGRCTIYPQRPFLCDVELIKVFEYKDHFRLGSQMFGRSWTMTRVDGQKNVLCELFDSENGPREAIRKLNRLQAWMQHFGLNTARVECIKSSVILLSRGYPLTFDLTKKKGLL
jgi:hypothetical protein